MKSFAIRNLKVFFKDKTAVFFSLLGVFIIIGLYVLFLGDVWANSLPDGMNAKLLMNTWVMAGILAVTSLTTTIGAYGTMVQDKALKIYKDLYVTPIKRWRIVFGYCLSAFVIGMILSLLAFVIIQLYLLFCGGKIFGFLTFLKIIAVIFLGTMTNTIVIYYLVSFFKSLNAFSTASSLIGTLIGFLTGIYLPIGTLPSTIQFVIKVFPMSHSTVLLRQIMMKDILYESFQSLNDEQLQAFRSTMGVDYYFGSTVFPSYGSVLVLFATFCLFMVLSILKLSKKKNL